MAHVSRQACRVLDAKWMVVGRGFRNANQGPTIVAEAISLAVTRPVSMPAQTTTTNNGGSTARGGGYDRWTTSSGLTH